MNHIIDNKLMFTNCKPSAYDSLGEIEWHLAENQAVCKEHGKIALPDVKLQSQYYDGCNWQTPVCPYCGEWFLGLPVNDGERAIVEKRRTADVE
jgi:hypothetical protein